MTWMFYGIDLIGNIMEELIAISYFRSVSGKKLKSVTWLVFVCVFFALFRLVPGILLGSTLVTIISAILCFLVISFSFEMSWLKRLIFTPLFYIVMVLSEMLVGLSMTSLTGIPIAEGQQMILFYAAGVLISRMLIFSLLKIIQFVVPSFGERSPGYLLFPLLILPAATFAVASVLEKYSYVEGPTTRMYIAVGALILLAVSNVTLFFLFEHQQREEKDKNRTRLLHQQMQNQVAYYRELAERQKISNKTMHDLKNQMFALTEAMKSAPDRAREIMDQISERIHSASPMAVTGNEAVDALIFTKRQQMEAEHIRFIQSVYVSRTAFDPLDLCVLLGNLLDNAIEACRKVEEDKRRIELSMTQQGPCLSISVQNSAAGKVRMEGNTVHTTKEQKELHGFGLNSVREIAEKYSGSCTIQSTEDEFTVYIILQEG